MKPLSGFKLVIASIAFLPLLILVVFVLVIGSAIESAIEWAIERYRYRTGIEVGTMIGR